MAEFDPDWPHGHQTRDGRKARILCRDARGDFPIIALVSEKKEDQAKSYTLKGRFMPGGDIDEADLVNAPAPKRTFKRWVNIFDNPISGIGAFGYELKCDADLTGDGTQKRVACILIECEEGDGL